MSVQKSKSLDQFQTEITYLIELSDSAFIEFEEESFDCENHDNDLDSNLSNHLLFH